MDRPRTGIDPIQFIFLRRLIPVFFVGTFLEVDETWFRLHCLVSGQRD